MDKLFRFYYTMWHETPRNRSATGKASPTGHPVAKSGQNSVGSRTGSKCLSKFSIPLVSGLPDQGSEGAGAQTHAGTSIQALSIPKTQTDKDSSKGSRVGWLSDRNSVPQDLAELKGILQNSVRKIRDPKNFSGPVSILLIYHGHGKYFHYLCENQ
jgi:hypothetical protein